MFYCFVARSLDDVSAPKRRGNRHAQMSHERSSVEETVAMVSTLANNEQQDATTFSEAEQTWSESQEEHGSEAFAHEVESRGAATDSTGSESEPKYLHAYFETMYYFGTNPYRTKELRARQQCTRITWIMNAMQKVCNEPPIRIPSITAYINLNRFYVGRIYHHCSLGHLG